MISVRQFVRDHRLVVFFALSYLLSWWSVPFVGGSILPHGPFLAAVIVLALTEGRKGLGELFRRIARWRVRWYWYLIAPGLVIGYLLAALAINLLLGATITDTSHLGSMGILASRALELLIFGGQWEEPGWTGYALPRLQDRFADRRYGLLKASLLMGAMRGLWHLPLVIYGAIPWYDAVFLSIAMQLLITWLFNRTGGSVLIVMLMHLTSNIVGGGIFVRLFSGSDFNRYYVLFIALTWALALLLVRPNNWGMGTRADARRHDTVPISTSAVPIDREEPQDGQDRCL